MTTIQSRERVSHDSLVLREYIAEVPNGVLVTYKNVATDTGVAMDSRGKARLRSAILFNGKVCETIPTVGYRLGQPATGHLIVHYRLRKVVRANRRLLRDGKIVMEEFGETMTQEHRTIVLATVSFAGAVGTAEQLALKTYSRTLKPLSVDVNIPIPRG